MLQGQENIVPCETTDPQNSDHVSYPAERALDSSSNESPSCGPCSLPGVEAIISASPLPTLHILRPNCGSVSAFTFSGESCRRNSTSTSGGTGSRITWGGQAECVYVCVLKSGTINSHFYCMDVSNSLNIQDRL